MFGMKTEPAPAANMNVVEKRVYAAEKEDYEIVDRIKNGQEHPTDSERLKAVCEDMGITIHQALKDAEFLKRADKLAPVAAQVESLQADAAVASGKYVERDKKFHEYAERETAEIANLRNDSSRLDQLVSHALDARYALEELKKRNPRAFGQPWRNVAATAI